jgi:hypothetical protein
MAEGTVKSGSVLKCLRQARMPACEKLRRFFDSVLLVVQEVAYASHSARLADDRPVVTRRYRTMACAEKVKTED